MIWCICVNRIHNYHSISWAQLRMHRFFQNPAWIISVFTSCSLIFVQNKSSEAQNYLAKTNAKNGSYLPVKAKLFERTNFRKNWKTSNAEEYWHQQLTQAKDIINAVYLKQLSNHLAIKQGLFSIYWKKAQITQPNLQRNFITQIANTNSLQKIIQSDQSNINQKQAAIYTLLSKSLVHQQFELFKQSFAFMP